MSPVKQSLFALAGACAVLTPLVAAKPHHDEQQPINPQHERSQLPHGKLSTGLCTQMPVGFCPGGVMIPDVVYYTPSMYLCAENNIEGPMSLWCEDDAQNPGNFQYRYCCGNTCEHMPKPVRSCMVNGYVYAVGYTYDVLFGDESGKLWCTTETEYVSCRADECGSIPELTPPGPTTCIPMPSPDMHQVLPPAGDDSAGAEPSTGTATADAANPGPGAEEKKKATLPELLHRLTHIVQTASGAGNSGKPVRLSHIVPTAES